jgi:hypothetical protein
LGYEENLNLLEGSILQCLLLGFVVLLVGCWFGWWQYELLF